MAMSLVLFNFALVFWNSLSQSNIFDPRVYNYYFYVTTNSDVISNNIQTEQQAANHWQKIGIFEGKQACGSFHVLQFLDNYPSLKQKYGTNYTAAIGYYLEKDGGYDQHMLGYTIGGGYTRYTLGNVTKRLYISGSLRMGASIDSLVWNNTEFVNNWGHGRQLQISVHNQSGACFDPNEAGTYNDWMANYSTSIILNISTSINIFESSAFPAFWTAPGETSNKGTCVAINQWNVSNFTMNKSIQFMNDDKYSLNSKYNVIQYNISIYIPYNMPFVHFEAPTQYLPKPFDTFYGVNMTKDMNGNYELINYDVNVNTSVESPSNIPVIIASNDSNYAVGVVGVAAVSRQSPTIYALYNLLDHTPDSNSCSKWNVQYVFNNVAAKTWVDFTSYLCVGTLNDVKNCMVNIYTLENAYKT
eukprot:205418_1